MRARRAAERGPGRIGPGDRGGPAGRQGERSTSRRPSASLFKTDVDWDYATLPEAGCNNRMMYMPRGKTLGGSSSINAMVYIRGAAWTTTAGDRPAGATTRCSRTSSGARTTSAARPSTTASAARCRSATAARTTRWPTRGSRRRSQAGLERNDDFNGASAGRRRPLPGDAAERHALLDRRRVPASRVAERPNLTIETRTHVHRVLLDGTRAVGVTGERDGEPVELRAEREVLLCAGRLQLAPAAAPVGHRTRRGARPRARSRSSSTCPAWAATSRTTSRSAGSGRPRSRSR